ncbi:unnamed protein product [Penicillium nalgiovense]|nr:unnamed protein product [Penicillium nalgiovense]
MSGGRSKQKAHKPGKYTAREYLANINPQYLRCLWDKGDWCQAHGDSKATFRGNYTMVSMKTTTRPPEYRLQLMCQGNAMLNFIMPGSPSKNGLTNPPTSQEVIDAIAIELTKIGK